MSVGSSTITAELKNPDGSIVSNTATATVNLSTPSNTLLSLTIIPSQITVANQQDTGQFLAIGTFSTAPTIRDLTNSVTWISDRPNVFPVNTNGTGVPNPATPAGVATAFGIGEATIVAEATDPAAPSNSTIQAASATFTCCSGSASPLLATLTVYNEGLNTDNWLVTAPSATGTINVLHCGPGSAGAGLGGSVCVATYPVGSTVTLTAPAQSGVNFGGWSNNCTNILPVTAAGPNSCTVTLTTSDTVGAIFN
jgi:hypothetical protein